MASKRKSQKVPPQPARGWRPWLFRLLAAVVLPGAALLVLEGGLRLAGSGYRTELLIPVAGREGVLTTNQRFGWRFFPRHLARGPVPLEIAASPPRETFRIFVVGGSAARGTPDSAYGFGRMLAVLLEASHGDRLDLEVVNAAMTAINSHVVLPIVADCARHAPDLFVVYLGNNEVVGPYGAGSVFRPLPPGLAAVRAGIALRSTRLGQLLDRGLAAAGGNPGPRRWQGMEMFLERRLAADDPRLEPVYRHFAANLEDTAEVAARAGARTLLATVAVNLADQPPFASLHRRALDGAAEKRWQARFDAGTAALAAGRPQQAIEHLGEAAEIDDGWAELHFHLGRAQAALGDLGSARASLARARDLDALRFRADSRINAVIRDVAARMADRGALFADVEAALSAASTGGLPGYELFHEHVHLTPAGNFAVATELWRVLTASDLLPPGAGGPLPSFEEVAERLALTDFDRYDLERDILGIVSRPPFTGQAGHGRDLARRRQTLAKLRGRLTAERWRDAEELYRRRLEADPDDLEIRRRFATGLAAHGTPADAAAEWRSLVDRLPDVPAWRSSLALALADAGDVDGAERQLEELLASWPETPETHVNLGTVDEKGGRFPQAIAHYRRALELAPDDAATSYNLGTALLESSDPEAAAAHFRELVAQHPDFAAAHHNLGHALEGLGDLDGAIASYRRAIDADPASASARNSLGLALAEARRFDEAAAAYLAALDAEPDFELAHFNLADLLLGSGRAATAAAHYRQGLRYRPDNVQARINLAIALQLLGDRAAAAAALEEAGEIARAHGLERLAAEVGRRLDSLDGG